MQSFHGKESRLDLFTGAEEEDVSFNEASSALYVCEAYVGLPPSSAVAIHDDLVVCQPVRLLLHFFSSPKRSQSMER